MNVNNLLPIGSVVLLKGGVKKVMICGIKQTDNASGKEFDYVSVVYPEGALGEEARFLFNDSDVAEIFFRGYEDEERTEFIKRLSEFYENYETDKL